MWARLCRRCIRAATATGDGEPFKNLMTPKQCWATPQRAKHDLLGQLKLRFLFFSTPIKRKLDARVKSYELAFPDAGRSALARDLAK